MKAAASFGLALLLASCSTRSSADRLVGTWEATSEPLVRVTYAADGTWQSSFTLDVDGASREFRGHGTWKVQDGAIHNTTLAHDEIPGMEPIELPYLSVEKLVSVDESEYRYVCPVQNCTNTMRRVDG